MASDPRPVFFLHISSAGGSSICRWAQQQPCARIPSCGANCNLGCAHPWDWKASCRPPVCSPPDHPCRPPYKVGCAGLRRHAQRNNLTFLASETMLHREPGERPRLCPGFRYVVLLRDPVERLTRQLERMSSQPNTRLRAMLASPFVFNTSERTSLMGTAAINNYAARMLLGPPAFFLPLGAFNDSLCSQASKLLAGFTAAVGLDQLPGGGSDHLASLLGWTGAAVRRNSHEYLLARHPRETPRTTPRTTPRATAAPKLSPRGRQLAARPPTLGERSIRLLRELNSCGEGRGGRTRSAAVVRGPRGAGVELGQQLW